MGPALSLIPSLILGFTLDLVSPSWLVLYIYIFKMSFQYSSLFIAGNTCHIEIESLPGTEGWHEFAAQLAARWMQIPGARPDWGKQWSFIPGVMEHMKEVGISRTIHITKIHHDNCFIL